MTEEKTSHRKKTISLTHVLLLTDERKCYNNIALCLVSLAGVLKVVLFKRCSKI